MAFRHPMVMGNWKMNGNMALVNELFSHIAASQDDELSEVVLCIPSVYLFGAQAQLKEHCSLAPQGVVSIGAQNVSEHESGAYTGEISPRMLQESGCRYVIIGHSERRTLYGESSQSVADKFFAAQQAGISPVVCVGETAEQRESGHTFEIVSKELDTVIARNGIMAFNDAVIAYEPLWAIGSGRSATPEQAQEVHAFIRKHLSSLCADVAQSVRILYGGSVNADNAESLFSMADIDGGLIGGASLKANEFMSLSRIAMSTKTCTKY